MKYRYVIAMLLFGGFFNAYTLRVNLSVAIVSMVSHNSSIAKTECPDVNKNSTYFHGEFNWSESLQGVILGAFFYGYITTQLIGGRLAELFGAKLLYCMGIFVTSVLSIVTPFAARASPSLLIALRIVEGIFEGVTFPCANALLSEWAPPLERSKMVSIAFAGCHFGTVISLPVTGLFGSLQFWDGWPLSFYFFGTIGVLWCGLWMWLASSYPAESRFVSAAEVRYIQESQSGLQGRNRKSPLRVPWRDMLTSMPVWAIAAAHTGNNWVFYSLLTCMPTYMQNVLGFDIKANGFLSAIPYALLVIAMTISGQVADNLRRSRWLTTKRTRQLFNTAGMLVACVMLVVSGYAGCNNTLAVALLGLSVAGLGMCMGAGFQCNHLDIAPLFAGTLLGFSNTFATVPGFLAPQLVGALTEGHSTRDRWQLFFYLSAAISGACGLIYLLFAAGEEQLWCKAAAHYSLLSEDPDDIQSSLPAVSGYESCSDTERRQRSAAHKTDHYQ